MPSFMRRLRPLLVLAALLLAGLPLAGPAAAAKKSIYIVTFRGCEETCQAFKAYIAARGLDVDYIERDLGRDASKLPGLVEEAKQIRPDLIVTWGTAITLAFVGPYDAADKDKYVTDIPVVYLYVADPVRARVVENTEVSGRPNVAGANILVPFDSQIRVMQSYRPIDRIAVAYGTNEPNSVAAVEALRDAAAKMKVDLVEKTFDLGADGKPLAQSIEPTIAALAAERPDFLVFVSSTFIINNIKAYTQAATDHGVPVFTAAELPIREADAMLGLFAPLPSIGQIAGYQAEQILFEGADPATLPTASIQRFTLLVNIKVAKQLELYPPMLLLRLAEITQ